jgi:predicted DNA binding CopG/RHH family protein
MNRKNGVLDEEEKSWFDAYESGQTKSVPNVEQEKVRIRTIFKNHAAKLHRVNIRLNEIDYRKAQALAIQEGIPSATLLSSLLHKALARRVVV